MNLEPNDLMLFARVAEEGSFSRAAERVGLPKSTVSRRIAGLESELGERLLESIEQFRVGIVFLDQQADQLGGVLA